MDACLDLADIGAGFSDPGKDSQAAFRLVLDALSHPGTIARFTSLPGLPPGIGGAAGAVLLSLLDPDTALWMPPGCGAAAGRYFRFHTGCRIADEAGAADFACVNAAGDLPSLAAFNGGTDACPDRSCTVLVEVSGLEAGSGWKLAGPGIERETRLAVAGLPEGFVGEWRAQRRRFPRGVDLVITCGERLAALPRSVGIEEA